jgi:hypothetical protein
LPGGWPSFIRPGRNIDYSCSRQFFQRRGEICAHITKPDQPFANFIALIFHVHTILTAQQAVWAIFSSETLFVEIILLRLVMHNSDFSRPHPTTLLPVISSMAALLPPATVEFISQYQAMQDLLKCRQTEVKSRFSLRLKLLMT